MYEKEKRKMSTTFNDVFSSCLHCRKQIEKSFLNSILYECKEEKCEIIRNDLETSLSSANLNKTEKDIIRQSVKTVLNNPDKYFTDNISAFVFRGEKDSVYLENVDKQKGKNYVCIASIKFINSTLKIMSFK
jgi:hypothetical protein